MTNRAMGVPRRAVSRFNPFLRQNNDGEITRGVGFLKVFSILINVASPNITTYTFLWSSCLLICPSCWDRLQCCSYRRKITLHANSIRIGTFKNRSTCFVWGRAPHTELKYSNGVHKKRLSDGLTAAVTMNVFRAVSVQTSILIMSWTNIDSLHMTSHTLSAS